MKSVGLRPPADPKPLKDLYDAKRYTDLIRYIKNSLSLKVDLRVAYVASGGPPGAPAWVIMPQPMPMYGTKAHEHTVVTVYFRKEFVERESFARVVAAIAHELSHIVLDGCDHPLKRDEKAVDLTAMVLGYRNFILDCESNAKLSFSELRSNPKRFFEQILALLRGERIYMRLGYLSTEEAEYALEIIEATELRNKMSAP